MPLTPRFQLSQTPSHVLVTVQAPHVRVNKESVQVVVTDDSVLHFASPPYLLKLDFAPRAFAEAADEGCATYDGSQIMLKLRKQVPGDWENLDLLGQLVEDRPSGSSRWLREVLDTEEDPETAPGVESAYSGSEAGYGFLRLFSGVFADLARDGMAKEMMEEPWIEGASDRVERREQRTHRELSDFSEERYWQDLEVEDDYIYQCAMAMEPHWRGVESLTAQLASVQLGTSSTDFFSSDERLQLSTIPYPLLPESFSDEQRTILLANLISLLFAYVYDHVTTDGDPTVESAWTVVTLSPVLGWLDEVSTVREALLTSLRRSLIYPYLRHWKFALYVGQQVVEILRQGVRCVIRCLLQVRTILDRSEVYYLGNKLWLDPYLKWLQRDASELEPLLSNLGAEVDAVLKNSSLKSEVSLDLDRIESGEFNHGEEESTSSSDDDDEESASSSEDSEKLTEDVVSNAPVRPLIVELD